MLKVARRAPLTSSKLSSVSNGILFCEKVNHRFKRMTGTRQASGLSNCIAMITDNIEGAVRAHVDDVEQSIVAIQRYSPSKVVFEGVWLSAEGCLKIQKMFPGIKIYVHIHSNIPFLAAESSSFLSILQYKDIGVEIIWNCEHAFNAMKSIINSHYLPNIYACKALSKVKTDDQFLDVACHGSMRLLKNQVIQAMAAINYANTIGKTLRFHVNMGRSEGGDDVKSSLKALFMMNKKHSLVEAKWLDHSHFIKSLTLMDIGLQVSMSETFNIVAADFVTAGVPMVVSPEIEWAFPGCFADCRSSASIERTMSYVLNTETVGINRLMLEHYSNEAKKKWHEFSQA